MKQLKALVLLMTWIVCSFSPAFCQHTNRLPDWVKEVTTQEEYKVWERVSEIFDSVDYSFFLKNLSEKKKEKLYKAMNNLFDVMEKGWSRYHDALLVFTVDILHDRISSTRFTVYHSKINQNACVDVLVSYHYDPETGEATNIDTQIYPVGIIPPV